jgi:hypothetical protein
VSFALLKLFYTCLGNCSEFSIDSPLILYFTLSFQNNFILSFYQRLIAMLAFWQELSELVSSDWLWTGLLGLVSVAGSFGLVAAKPIVSSAVQRLEKGPTRDFLLESRISKALGRKYEAPPVQSGNVSKSHSEPLRIWPKTNRNIEDPLGASLLPP